LAVAQALNLVDDRNLWIARQDEIAMDGMWQPSLHGAAGRDHRLSDHLTAEYPLPARLRAVAAEQIHLERLPVGDGDQVDQAFGHWRAFSSLVDLDGEPGISRKNLWIPGSRLSLAPNDEVGLVSPSYFPQLYSCSKSKAQAGPDVGTAKHCHWRRRVCGS